MRRFRRRGYDSFRFGNIATLATLYRPTVLTGMGISYVNILKLHFNASFEAFGTFLCPSASVDAKVES